MDPEEISYPRNSRIMAAMPVIAGACLLAGLATLAVGAGRPALVWWCMAGLWYANYRLSRKTPFAVLTEEALNLFPSPVLPRKVIPWDQAARVRLLAGYRCQIYLRNGRRIDFRLFWLNAAHRAPLIERIERAIARNGFATADPPAFGRS